jgi:hypothetical protein
MSTKLGKALTNLNLGEWVLRGTPTNETEFNAMFRKITGSKDGVAIESSKPSDFGVTWSQVKTEMDKE